MRPGAKYYDWEMRGVPLRLEIGARDIENKVVSFARRDTAEKGTMDLNAVSASAKLLLNDISATLYERAKEVQESAVTDLTDMSEASIEDDETKDDVILRFGWCGNEDCGHTFEETTGYKILGTPYGADAVKGDCIVCGAPSDKQAYAAHPM